MHTPPTLAPISPTKCTPLLPSLPPLPQSRPGTVAQAGRRAMGEGPGAGANGHPRPQQSRTTTTNRLLQTVRCCWFEFGGRGGGGASRLARRVCSCSFLILSPPKGLGGPRRVPQMSQGLGEKALRWALLARGHARKQLQRYDGLFIVSYGFLWYSAQDHNVGNSEKE